MSESAKSNVGDIVWQDLTIEDADTVRDFYEAVVGWKSEPVDMGEYSDYAMTVPDTGKGVAGVCHLRGGNVGLPPQWLLYVTVDDIDRSIERCVDLGGEIVRPPKSLGAGRFCVIRDPAGAVMALYSE